MPEMNWAGREVIPSLAEIYQQLYVVPSENGAEQYREIVLKGHPPARKNLDHFITSDNDSCCTEHTPAGDATVITLDERADFEMFLQIMCNRCTPQEIPATQGAVHVSGIINRPKVDAFMETWHKEHPDASPQEWTDAFQAFQKDKSGYTDTLIILSTGPYSAVPAEDMNLSEAEWLRLSLIIRKTHELTHFICRKLFPSQVSAVWDELVADAAGLYAAFDCFEPARAERFLGIRDGLYVGGRLENYCPDGTEKNLQALSEKIHAILLRFEKLMNAPGGASLYDLILELEQRQSEWWPENPS